MPDENLRLGDMPKEFGDVLMREFVPYSVAMAWVSSREKQKFTPFGSGTLVDKNGAIGILTAQHCIAKMRREAVGHDCVVVLVSGSRPVYVQPQAFVERQVTTPMSEEFGPDLAFIEIAPCEQQQTIRAVGSVWPMNQSPESLLSNFSSEGTFLASLGFPEERCETTPIEEGFRRRAYHLTSCHVIQPGDILEQDGWDYIQSTCFYCDENDLPRSFAGTSGGGIWALKVLRNCNGELSVGRSALVGVSFYQTKFEDNTRFVRGHFIKSIHDVMWRS